MQDDQFFVSGNFNGFKAYQIMPDGRERALSHAFGSFNEAMAWLEGYLEAFADMAYAKHLESR